MNEIELFLVTFVSIVFEALPFIAIGALISGALEELLPQGAISKLLPKRRPLAIAGSALLGLAFPMCECGIVPVMRRLLGKGLPLSCAVAYMLAAPIINPVVIASTAAAFSSDRSDLDNLTGIQMITLRVGMAFIVAFIVGLIVEARVRKGGVASLIQPIRGMVTTEPAPAGESSLPLVAEPAGKVHDAAATPELQKKTPWQRLSSILETALHDFMDITCFLILGAALASFVQSAKVLEYAPNIQDSPFLAAPTMMVLAVLMCLCSEADAFVAANINPIPLAGKLGFLVLGPMLDLKLYLMYTRVFRSKLIWTIIPAVVACVLILSLAVDGLHQWFEWKWPIWW
jgi:hypothetical protein